MTTDSVEAPIEDVAYQFSKWKLALLGFAGVLLVGGLVVRLVAAPAESGLTPIPVSDGAGTVSGFNQKSGFAPDNLPDPTYVPEETTTIEPRSGADPWSPALLRGGFGFFLGFCIGYAIRMFIRMAAIAVGINFLVIALFNYLGWVDVRWDTMTDQLDLWFSNFREQFDSFQAFLLGSLPSTALGGLGLFTGLKRK